MIAFLSIPPDVTVAVVEDVDDVIGTDDVIDDDGIGVAAVFAAGDSEMGAVTGGEGECEVGRSIMDVLVDVGLVGTGSFFPGCWDARCWVNWDWGNADCGNCWV